MNNENPKQDMCIFCGKKARGNCPALKTAICSYCCGSKRNDSVNCGNDCEFNVLSVRGYDAILKIDEVLTRKMHERVLSACGREKFEKTIARLTSAIEGNPETYGNDAYNALLFLMFIEPGAGGATLARQWAAASWEGMTNDEKAVMKYKKDTLKMTIIEIQKIIDHQILECVDLLEDKNKKFIVVDRSLAQSAARFMRLLIWIARYPYYCSLFGAGIEITDFVESEFMDGLYLAYNREKDKNPGWTLNYFLAANCGKLLQKQYSLVEKKHKNILQKMDLHQCKAVYEIKDNFKKVKEILDTLPEFEAREKGFGGKPAEGDLYYCWVRRGESKAIEKNMPAAFRHSDDESFGVGLLANVTLNARVLLVETFTKQKYEFLKKMAAKYFKGLAVLADEIIVDLAKQMAKKVGRGEEEAELMPQKTVEELPHEVKAEVMRKFNRNFYEKFLDDNIPALNGLTPRQAAKDKKMRPALVELMKVHLKGMEKRNKSENFGLNIDWVLDELNLRELK